MKDTLLHHKGKLIKQIPIAFDIFRMTIKIPELVQNCRPGQFINIRINKNFNPLLRRPFSISRVHKNQSTIDILYKIVGQGTRIMSSFDIGTTMDIIGPLGNGFNIDADSFETALIISGGIGCAPTIYLIDELLKNDKKIIVLSGFKTVNDIIKIPQTTNSSVKTIITTEDGSFGIKGYVTDLVTDFLKNSNYKGFVCGPNQMLHQLQKIVSRNSTNNFWQVSLECRMACAIGVCQGCIVRFNKGGYQLTCSDGPVFNLMDIDFNG